MIRYTGSGRGRRAVAAIVLVGTFLLGSGVATAAPPDAAPPSSVKFRLTLLHNNDGESQLVNAPGQPDFGGVARFKTLVDELRADAADVPPGPEAGIKQATVTLSSGDNFLAGPRFLASLEKGVPFYDSIALRAVGYDAMIVGNHEFDFGPDVFADFVDGFAGNTTFVSANLDVSGEPRLAALRSAGILASSVVIKEKGENIGIVGATTPRLPFISSPRNVAVLQNVAEVVQAEIDRLSRMHVDKIVFASHLQDVREDRAVIAQLHGVDIAIAGGGDELLANADDLLVPGDARAIDPATGQPLTYPTFAPDADGVDVPIVTTAGDYKYVGRLVVDFDGKGNVIDVDEARSGPVRVSGVAPDAVAPDPVLQQQVVQPVVQFVAGLAENVLAQSEVALEGRRDPGVRTQETNLGNLHTDGMLNAAQARAGQFGVDPPQIAVQNGGGIRNNSLIPAGPITELNTFDIAAFPNFVSVVEDVPRSTIKALLENAVSLRPGADGRFAQIAGFRYSYDTTGTAQVTAVDGTILVPGTRVQDVVLDDGTVLVESGAVVPGDPIDVATIDFLARGGDQYPLIGLPFTTLGITYQQALAEQLTDVLGGVVSAADYPLGETRRIFENTPLP
jgi:2',3'-cyclic-nucleotide 2'-phosphodiesterase (5'-nucleotidase family)